MNKKETEKLMRKFMGSIHPTQKENTRKPRHFKREVSHEEKVLELLGIEGELGQSTCPWCSLPFVPKDEGQAYCCNACGHRAGGLTPNCEHTDQCTALSEGSISGLLMDALRGKAAQQEQVVEQDSTDKRLWQELKGEAKEVENHLYEHRNNPLAEPLFRDLFASYYKTAPHVLDEDQVKPGYRPNRNLIEKVLNEPATKEARLATVLDELSSGLAALATGKALLQECTKNPDLFAATQAAQKAAQEKNPQEAQALADYAQKIMDNSARAVRQAVREAAKAGQEQALDVRETMAGWGLEPGDLHLQGNLGSRLEFVRRLQKKKVKHLAKLIGRFRNLARARQREKVTHERDEIHSVTVGNDLPHILPAELALLGSATRKADFYRRYTEKQLLQYDLHSRQPQGRGPMVVLVDCSGSMAGERMDWATAVSLALVDTANRQKRHAAVVHFHTKVVQRVEFIPGKRNPADIVRVGSVGATGGTDYLPAFTEALERIAQQDYKKADIVMVTDGECQLPEGFVEHLLDRKRDTRFRIWSVLVGATESRELTRYSDRVWSVNQLTDDVAGEIFENVY